MSDIQPVSHALGVLSEILRREKSRGKTHLAIAEASEKTLTEMPVNFMIAAQNSQAGAVSVSSAPEKTADVQRNEEWARKELNAIFKEVKTCEVCRSLGTLRDSVVFATGNPMADLMFVGEAPGAEEEKERKPFVGPAGQKLTQIIKAMGLSREEVYISNIVKFRPKKGDGRFQGSSNRKPDSTEMEACIRFIRKEIEVVAPKVIVALGATAAEGLLERGGAISSLREQRHEFAGVPVFVTYHPSFLLRQESEPNAEKARASKRKVWEDMLKVMEHIGMPVSEKQRGFFS
ncbi:MAG: uracil-DNA glycosylase [Verrucomicrobiales bacterium]|nr:uracil-DNA glycosylase [Verrucomicrobiales bacterium]